MSDKVQRCEQVQPRAEAYHEQLEQRNQHNILEHAAKRNQVPPSSREVTKKGLDSPDDRYVKYPAIKQGTDSVQAQDICRRVPSRQNRCKRAGTFHSSSIAASPMNALHDILYLHTPLSSCPTEMEFEMSAVTSQAQAAIQVIGLYSNWFFEVKDLSLLLLFRINLIEAVKQQNGEREYLQVLSPLCHIYRRNSG